MDQTLKNIRVSDEGVELFDRLEKLDDLCTRIDALDKEQETERETCKEAFNIGLSAF